jgi:hypothetical protein
MKKMEKVDGPDADKSEWVKFEFLMDPDNPASRYFKHFVIFKDISSEKWIKWVMAYCKIENRMPFKDSFEKTRMLQTC